MKPNKIPTLQIKKPFSCNPVITKRISKIWVTIKASIIIILLSIALMGSYYLNIQHERKLMQEQSLNMEIGKAYEGTGMVVDATAIIIEREGKLPHSVAKKYAIWIYEAAAKHGVDPLLVLSVMTVESKFDYRAISPTGPIGLLQIAASWHKDKTTKVALFDPQHNINVGTQILKEYSNLSHTEVETLLRYNGSLGSAPVYAVKVLSYKRKYEEEIMKTVINNI